MEPWDFSLHDYFIISRGWSKFPPPHIVAGAFVSKSNDGEDESKPAKSKRKPRKADKEQSFNEALAAVQTDPMLSTTLRKGRADPKQRVRLDNIWRICEALDGGTSFDDIPIQ